MTPKQTRFVDEYLIDLNATQAAIRAGYSKHTAKDIGCQNLAKLNIAEAIAERRNVISDSTLVDAQRVIQGLLKEAEGLPEDTTQSARVAAWAHIGKHLGMFVERSENLNHNYYISDTPLTEAEWSKEYVTEH